MTASPADLKACLVAAARDGCMEAVRALVEECGADVKGFENEMSPLHEAAGINAAEIMEYLIEKGAAVDQVDSAGNTSLFYCAGSNSIEAVKCLVETGKANLHTRDNNGQCALHGAVLPIQYNPPLSAAAAYLLANTDIAQELFIATKIGPPAYVLTNAKRRQQIDACLSSRRNKRKAEQETKMNEEYEVVKKE